MRMRAPLVAVLAVLALLVSEGAQGATAQTAGAPGARSDGGASADAGAPSDAGAQGAAAANAAAANSHVIAFGGAPEMEVSGGVPTAIGAAPNGSGVWTADAAGVVTAAGRTRHMGDTSGLALARPVVDLASTPSGRGYWLVAADGGLFTYGDARFGGSAAGLALASPIVAIEPTRDGRGYWMLGRDGGVFTYGTATYHGSLPQIGMPGPAVAMAASPTGRGYLIATADGGIFNFGDSMFAGSLYGRVDADDEVVDVAGHGDRYRLLTHEGRVVTFTPRRRVATRVQLPPNRRAVAFALDPVRDQGWVLATEHTPFTMAFSGDLLPHVSVVNVARDFGAASGWAYDFRPMFDQVRPLLSEADLAICHLETTLSVTDTDLSGYPRFRAPGELADAIAGAGYDGCSISSNHALDFGFDGVVTTLNQLDRVGVRHSGTARSHAEATTPTIYNVGGVRVGHLSFSYGFNGALVPPEAPWSANLIDPARILADAAATRQAGAQLVVVSLHWGAEYRSAPTSEQRALGQQLLASPDVDLIIGHHAHVVQPVQRIGDEFIVYGLGNFLSGQSAAPRRDGVVVLVDVEIRSGVPKVEAIRYQPTWVDRPNVIRVATPGGPLADSWARTKSVMEMLGIDPAVGPVS